MRQDLGHVRRKILILRSIGQKKAVLVACFLLVTSGTANSHPTTGTKPTVTRIKGVSYPRVANQARVEGVVELVARVSAAGAVQSVRVVLGHPLLADSAKD